LTSDVLEILRGTDDIWKYWSLHVFGLWSKKPVDKRLIDEIKRIATTPTKGEQTEEVDQIARQIIGA